MRNDLLNFPTTFKLKVFTDIQNISDDDRPYLESAYRTWKEVWLDVYNNEMGQNSNLYSNEFTRQTYIVSLFQNNCCIGVSFMRLVDIQNPINLEDSYFRFWPKELLTNLKYKNIILASYFTISNLFRKNKKFEWKTLFLALYKDFYDSLDQSLMITAARKIRSNEKLCYDIGGICLQKDVIYKNEASQLTSELADILYWIPKTHFTLLNPVLQQTREQIWKDFQREKDYELLSA